MRAFHPDKVGPDKKFTFAELQAEMDKYQTPVQDEAAKVTERLIYCQEFNRFMVRDLLAKTEAFKKIARRKSANGTCLTTESSQ